MTRYRFLTTWLLDAPVDHVWDVLYDAKRWPVWWRGVVRADVLSDDLWRSTWRSFLPYELTFEFEIVRRERPHLLEGRARGELAGTGLWRLCEGPAGTASTWDWDVATTARWMNALGPAARPAFAWNHHWVMRRGAEGLARELGCELVGAS
jgi:Polyketide cyclase / dehydrase and lipid transport